LPLYKGQLSLWFFYTVFTVLMLYVRLCLSFHRFCLQNYSVVFNEILYWWLYQRLSAYFHRGTYLFSITSMFHEAEIQMYQISLNQKSWSTVRRIVKFSIIKIVISTHSLGKSVSFNLLYMQQVKHIVKFLWLHRNKVVKLFQFVLLPYSLTRTFNNVQNCTFQEWRNIL
jgi:hypothetical protein